MPELEQALALLVSARRRARSQANDRLSFEIWQTQRALALAIHDHFKNQDGSSPLPSSHRTTARPAC